MESSSLKYAQPITTKFCTSRHLHCRDVCKISLWLVELILNQSTANFGRISNSIEISSVGRAPGPLLFNMFIRIYFSQCQWMLMITASLIQVVVWNWLRKLWFLTYIYIVELIYKNFPEANPVKFQSREKTDLKTKYILWRHFAKLHRKCLDTWSNSLNRKFKFNQHVSQMCAKAKRQFNVL